MKKDEQSLKQIVSRYKGAIVVALQVLILGVAINVFFVPKIQDIFDLRDQIERKKVEAASTSSYVSYLQSLDGITLDIEGDVVHYALPSENDVISLIVTYEGLGSRGGVELSPLEFSPGLISNPTQKELKAQEALLNNEGVKEGVKAKLTAPTGIQSTAFDATAVILNEEVAQAFIKDVYNTRRMLDIERLAWKTNDEGRVTLTMTVNAYYYPEATRRASEKLVREGQLQEDFISQLKNTTVYEEYILDNVQVGHEDLFKYGAGVTLPTPTPIPGQEQEQLDENEPENEDIQEEIEEAVLEEEEEEPIPVS